MTVQRSEMIDLLGKCMDKYPGAGLDDILEWAYELSAPSRTKKTEYNYEWGREIRIQSSPMTTSETIRCLELFYQKK